MSDLGQRIFCRVIGSNVYGADTAYTQVVGPVTAFGTLINLVPPEVTGTTEVGQTLHVDDGIWAGSLPIMFAYQWYQEGGLGGDVLTDELSEPLTDELEEELTT